MIKIGIKVFLIGMIFGLKLNVLNAQEDCILGVGISKDQTLIEVFQLNEAQKEQLINLSAELKIRNEHLDNQAANLLKRHPQGNPSELAVLAEKYTVIVDSIQKIQKMIDVKVLRSFNKKQYERYLQLCKEMIKYPIHVVPETLLDTIAPE